MSSYKEDEPQTDQVSTLIEAVYSCLNLAVVFTKCSVMVCNLVDEDIHFIF